MSSIKTKTFGRTGGDAFAMAVIKEIGLRSDKQVDQITINDIPHGRNGGHDRGSITLGSDEYINKVELRHGQYIDQVRFTTNKGNSVEGGGKGGEEAKLENIRVMAIGGRSGRLVDNLKIMYIDNYEPSKVVAKNQGFIIAYSAPFQKFEEYNEDKYKTADSYEKVTEHMLSQTYKASVEGEYYVKVAASTEIAIKSSTLETVRKELQTELQSGKKVTQEIPKNHVGVKLVTGTLMSSADGNEFWMFPTSQPSYSVIKLNEVNNILGRYDLTGQLDTQMPDLKKYKTEKNGYVYYNE